MTADRSGGAPNGADGSSTRRRSPLPPTPGASATSEALQAILIRGAATAGYDEAAMVEHWAKEDARGFAQFHADKADPLDPLARHVPASSDRIEGDRGGPPTAAAAVFGDLLDAVPRAEPGTLPSATSSSTGSERLSEAVESPQAQFRPARDKSRKKHIRRDERRRQQRIRDKQRLAELREQLFAAYGQVPDIPEMPPLKPQVREMNRHAMADAKGRRARELIAKLPLTQQVAVYSVGWAALDWVRRGVPCEFRREDFERAAPLPEGGAALAAALKVVRDEVVPTVWFRRIACSAWGVWAHRGHPLSEAAQRANRGGVFRVDGYCQSALSWLVPKADGDSWSRSVLWGVNGPFALLGAAARKLGRAGHGPSGAGLWTRWQEPAGRARFKGPTKKNPKTGAIERFAVATMRYDKSMAGGTAVSLAKRGRGAVRAAARVLVTIMTPWVSLPAMRRPKGATRRAEAEEPPSESAVAASPPEARAPP